MHHLRSAAAALLLSAAGTAPLEAQAPAAAAAIDAARGLTTAGAQTSTDTQQSESSVPSRSGWRPLNVAKWTTAAAAAGLAVYGVVVNRRADERFEQLEQSCIDEPLRCSERLPDGAYGDAALEARYQDVRALDRRARTALIAGQVGVGASVVLFLMDLRNSDGPENIPYEPRTIDIMPARDGGMSVRLNLRLPSPH